jgi:hypothetical protein
LLEYLDAVGLALNRTDGLPPKQLAAEKSSSRSSEKAKFV